MKVMMHICCGICAGSVAERLLTEGHEVTGYFFNPNIHPLEEYERRLDVARVIAKSVGFSLEAGKYDPESWFQATIGLDKEPEGGRRCEVCYRLRLQETFRVMSERGLDAFTTTLTVSPHKPAYVVNPIGEEIAGDKFIARDFKKKDGFNRANEIAKKLGVYRQHYCGCVYSMGQEHED